MPEPKRRGLSRWLFTFLLVVLLAALAVFAWSTYRGIRQRAERPELPPLSPDEARKIRIEVLNGSDKEGAGMIVAQFLRNRGFDVVGIGNAEAQDFEKTIVVDRVDNHLGKANPVARSLGVAPEEVVPLKNSDLLLEVSVYVGKDYEAKIKRKGGSL
jgi:hypothetical protein